MDHDATSRATRRRGQVLVLFSITMAVFLGLTVVAIDVGHLAHVATEEQAVADVAATAGATALLLGGSAATARSQAQTAVSQNRVAGALASIASGDIQVGQYNPQTLTFNNGHSPANAVRATPNVAVQNLVAGYFGAAFLHTTVSKVATAGFSGLGQGAATLPLVIGDCNFPALDACFGTAGCLPRLTNAPNTTNNTAWTSFSESPTNQNSVEPYLPAQCGGSRTPPTISIGTTLNLNNGVVTPLFWDALACFKVGIRQFLVPVVSCSGNFNQSAPVTGFATIVVTDVRPSGNGKGIDLATIFTQNPGPPGGGAYGTGAMRLFD